MSALRVRGEWEAERGRGRGIVVCSNGGFPPPDSQTHHVTHPEKERDPDRGQFRGGFEAEGVVTPQTGQTNSVFSSLISLTATDQIAANE